MTLRSSRPPGCIGRMVHSGKQNDQPHFLLLSFRLLWTAMFFSGLCHRMLFLMRTIPEYSTLVSIYTGPLGRFVPHLTLYSYQCNPVVSPILLRSLSHTSEPPGSLITLLQTTYTLHCALHLHEQALRARALIQTLMCVWFQCSVDCRTLIIGGRQTFRHAPEITCLQAKALQ
jgi:hypothetical protein